MASGGRSGRPNFNSLSRNSHAALSKRSGVAASKWIVPSDERVLRKRADGRLNDSGGGASLSTFITNTQLLSGEIKGSGVAMEWSPELCSDSGIFSSAITAPSGFETTRGGPSGAVQSTAYSPLGAVANRIGPSFSSAAWLRHPSEMIKSASSNLIVLSFRPGETRRVPTDVERVSAARHPKLP